MCIIQGFINFLCLYASLFFLAAIATNRFAKTWSMKYTQLIYTRRNTGIMFLTLWLMSVTAAALPVLGWGRYAFDNIRDNCIFDRRAAPSYSFFLASVGILLPLTICAVSYILVLITFFKSRSRVGDRGTINGSGATSRSEMRLTRNLFLVWLVFFVCWTPMISLLFIDPQGLSGRTAYVVAVWFMLCNSCINPIIYGLTNKKFRRGYQTVVRGCVNRRIRTSRIQPSPTDVRRISRLKQRPGVGERGRFNPNLLQVRPLSPRRY
ncbi:melatonin-related receptor-like [Haliotis rufescens]|uniref:melatonin-related receptor-like n=1 Tax=Haliotis rufescens TaxID=6454 RepID=UPI00201EB4AD|nr:melatonin-related receptor-like [Haliotis rufescens]